MTLRSMTGFGVGEASGAGLKIEVEMSAVNRKQFDVRVGLPRAHVVLEPRVRELIQKGIARGNVTVTVRVSVADGSQLKGISVDRSLSRALLRQLRQTAKELGLADDLTASSLLRLPEVIQCKELSEDSEKVWLLLKKALRQALGELNAMREAEGATLASDLQARLAKLRRRLKALQKLAPLVPARCRVNLHKRLKTAGLGVGQLDEVVAREIALFADRSDISEEIVRLDSHFQQAEQLMGSRKPVGRALDFVCQEMFREINTIGSKGNDARISRQVIHFKTELESVREQVQNIE